MAEVHSLRLAEGFIAVKPLAPVPVKGLDTPVEVYELTGAGPLRSRLHAGTRLQTAAARDLAPPTRAIAVRGAAY